MKILYIADFIPPRIIGGPGKRLYALAKKISQAGNDVYFITSAQEKNIPFFEQRDGLKIFNVYSQYSSRFRDYLSIYNFRVLSDVGKIIKEIKPEVAHIDTVHSHLSYAVLKIAKKYAGKVFFTARDQMTFHYGKLFPKTKQCGDDNFKTSFFDNLRQAKLRFNPLRNVLIRHYLKYADKIFAVSDILKEMLEQNKISNVAVIHNGLEVKAPSVSEDFFLDFKNQNNLLGKKVVFLTGRVNYAKGIYVVLDILRELKKEIPEIVLLTIGAPEGGLAKIKEYASNLEISDNLRILAWLNDEKTLEAAYLASHVVVSPSLHFDPFPGVNLEAAIYKKPVVTTCFGGAKEFVADGITGYVINPYNSRELAEKIKALLLDEEKARKFGQAAYLRITNEFSLDKQLEKILDWYNNKIL